MSAALPGAQRLCGAALCSLLAMSSANAQSLQSEGQIPPPVAAAAATDPQTPSAPSAAAPAGTGQNRMSCQSRPGERQHCAADTSSGVALLKSTGTAPCLLGKTWGYDDTGIWVSDGCSGEFLAGPEQEQSKEKEKEKPPEYIPNLGFLLYSGEKGEIYFRLFSYARYLNQLSLDSTYVDAFGTTRNVQRRQDIQLQKFFAPFSGWFLTPKFRYYLYVWSSNPSQGDPAQVVGAGNLSYTFNRFVTLGGGITSLPAVRSTEGQFPYWLGVDDRMMADEFFRGSYTDGVWLKGELNTKVKYMAMVGNNLSILGVSATQLDNKLDTQSFMVGWFPTTGEFGLYGTFGDYDDHQKVATRLAGHYTHSLEDRQMQPGTNAIENSQIRLTDGSVVFTPDLFGPGITVDQVDYQMMSIDGGVKYHGVSIEAEYYRRWLTDFTGVNTASHRDGHRQRVSGAVVSHGRAEDASGVPERLADSWPLRQRVRAARRRQLVLHQPAWPASERGVASPGPLPGRIHRRSVSGWRQRQRVPRQCRIAVLADSEDERPCFPSQPAATPLLC